MSSTPTPTPTHEPPVHALDVTCPLCVAESIDGQIASVLSNRKDTSFLALFQTLVPAINDAHLQTPLRHRTILVQWLRFLESCRTVLTLMDRGVVFWNRDWKNGRDRYHHMSRAENRCGEGITHVLKLDCRKPMRAMLNDYTFWYGAYTTTVSHGVTVNVRSLLTEDGQLPELELELGDGDGDADSCIPVPVCGVPGPEQRLFKLPSISLRVFDADSDSAPCGVLNTHPTGYYECTTCFGRAFDDLYFYRSHDWKDKRCLQQGLSRWFASVLGGDPWRRITATLTCPPQLWFRIGPAPPSDEDEDDDAAFSVVTSCPAASMELTRLLVGAKPGWRLCTVMKSFASSTSSGGTPENYVAADIYIQTLA